MFVNETHFKILKIEEKTERFDGIPIGSVINKGNLESVSGMKFTDRSRPRITPGLFLHHPELDSDIFCIFFEPKRNRFIQTIPNHQWKYITPIIQPARKNGMNTSWSFLCCS